MLSRELNGLLPGFFTSLVKLSSQTTLLPAILASLHSLISEHPNAFRPTFSSANACIQSIFGGNGPLDVKELSGKVYANLHHSAPKGTNSEYWRTSLLEVISEAHLTLDSMFEVIEEGLSRLY